MEGFNRLEGRVGARKFPRFALKVRRPILDNTRVDWVSPGNGSISFKGGKMPVDRSPTEVLVRKAKGGDREAWNALVERFYESWLRRYHGRLGTGVARWYDTQGLVNSAVGDAIRDLPRLRNDAAFFAWVTAIIRHKMAIARRTEVLARPAGDQLADLPDGKGRTAQSDVIDLDTYLHTLYAILALFPKYPEEMAAVSLKLLDGCTIPEMVERLEKPERTVYHWLRKGTELLKARIKA
jgi:DNA-directed RNA polymerase specialized sigma24 family protein